MPSNYPTDHAVDFAAQLNLPGIQPAARVTVGYILNRTQTEIVAILVTYCIGNRIEWIIEIEEASIQTNVVPYPSKPLTKPRVRPKEIKRKKKTENEEE